MEPSSLYTLTKKNEVVDPPLGIIFIRKTLIFLAVILTAASIIGIGSYLVNGRRDNILETILETIISWITIYGISKRRGWTVVFVLFCAYFGLIRGTIDFLYMKPSSPSEMFSKLTLFAVLTFWSFQIFIFSRTETKRYFKDKGKTLIS